MMDFLRKYRSYIFIVIISVFLFGTFFSYGAYTFLNKSRGDTIAEVNGERIPARVFLSHYRRAAEQAGGGKPLEKSVKTQLQNDTLRDLVQSYVFAEQAKKFKIDVPDQQVVMSIAQIPAFREKENFNPQLYMQTLQQQLRMTPQDFEEEQRRSIAFFKLRWLIQSAIKVTDKEFEIEAPLRAAGKPLKTAADREALRQQMWQEKVLYSFNVWFNHLGQGLKVEQHMEILEGAI